MQILDTKALKAMELFLEKYHQKSKNDDLGLLLSDISTDTFIGTETADPAAWEDWQDAIVLVKGNNVTKYLTEQQAFDSMINYLRTFGIRINSQEISSLLKEILINAVCNKPTLETWHFWQECLKKSQNC